MLRVAEHFSDSDLGRQRQGNEDSLFARSPVFVVADGMGGAQAGEVASSMAIEAFDAGVPGGAPAAELAEIIAAANARIHASSRRDERRAGMGTTITAAYVGEEDVTIAHVGDSRAYLLRRGRLTRLTRDHTLVEELIARGKLTEEQAGSHPQRSVITRSVGPEPEVEVDTETYPAREGDVFLICSDGLTSMVPEAGLLPVLTGAGSLAQAGRRLIAAANEAGGRDNITVVLFRLEAVHARAGAVGDAGAERPTLVGDTPPRTEELQVLPSRTQAGEAGSAGDTGSLAVADPEAARHEEPDVPAGRPVGPPATPGRRRRRIPPVAIVLFLIAIPVISGTLLTLRAVYFVGTDPNDGRTITVFRGLPYELPGGLRLYTRYGGSGVTLDAVPSSRRAVFTDHKLRSRDDARSLVDELELGQLDP